MRWSVVVVTALRVGVARGEPSPAAPGCDVDALTCTDVLAPEGRRVVCRVPLGLGVAGATMYEQSTGAPLVTQAMERRGACTYTQALASNAEQYTVVARDAAGHAVFTLQERRPVQAARVPEPPVGAWPVAEGAIGASVGAGLGYLEFRHNYEPQGGIGNLWALISGVGVGVLALPTSVCIVGSLADKGGSCALAFVGTFVFGAVGAKAAVSENASATVGVATAAAAAASGAVLLYYLGRGVPHLPYADHTVTLGPPIVTRDRETGTTSLSLTGRF